MSRATTAEGVLETIYSLAGVDAAGEDDGDGLSRPSARGAAERRRGGVLRRLAGAGRGRRVLRAQEARDEADRDRLGRRWRRCRRSRSSRRCARPT